MSIEGTSEKKFKEFHDRIEELIEEFFPGEIEDGLRFATFLFNSPDIHVIADSCGACVRDMILQFAVMQRDVKHDADTTEDKPRKVWMN